jgi:hypothetical protein
MALMGCPVPGWIGGKLFGGETGEHGVQRVALTFSTQQGFLAHQGHVTPLCNGKGARRRQCKSTVKGGKLCENFPYILS